MSRNITKIETVQRTSICTLPRLHLLLVSYLIYLIICAVSPLLTPHILVYFLIEVIYLHMPQKLSNSIH